MQRAGMIGLSATQTRLIGTVSYGTEQTYLRILSYGGCYSMIDCLFHSGAVSNSDVFPICIICKEHEGHKIKLFLIDGKQ